MAKRGRNTRRSNKPAYSKHPGVTFEKHYSRRLKPWKAYIHWHRKQYNLGRYETEEAAIAAFDAALTLYPL